MIHFQKYSAQFHPVIALPVNYEIYDFTHGYNAERKTEYEYGIGRYNEKRAGMYTSPLFQGERNIHMGIDIAAPINTAVYSFASGTFFLFGNNSQEGDYGFTIITEHFFDGIALYALYGHLSKKSVDGKSSGQKINAGETIGWIGNKEENGGWNPHLHFQLSYKKPSVPDMPGVVSEKNLEEALRLYPDPQLVLGKLY